MDFTLHQNRGKANAAKLAERQGKTLPSEYEEPELWFGLRFYFNAFFMLSKDRKTGFSVGCIPYTSMLMYCEDYGIYDCDREDFYYIMSALDAWYIECQHKKEEQKRAQQKTDKRNGKRR